MKRQLNLEEKKAQYAAKKRLYDLGKAKFGKEDAIRTMKMVFKDFSKERRASSTDAKLVKMSGTQPGSPAEKAMAKGRDGAGQAGYRHIQEAMRKHYGK